MGRVVDTVVILASLCGLESIGPQSFAVKQSDLFFFCFHGLSRPWPFLTAMEPVSEDQVVWCVPISASRVCLCGQTCDTAVHCSSS
jgi:hypothetical protein